MACMSRSRPSAMSTRVPLALSWTPAPSSRSSEACSKISTSIPLWSRDSAATSPPTPAPAISTFGGFAGPFTSLLPVVCSRWLRPSYRPFDLARKINRPRQDDDELGEAARLSLDVNGAAVLFDDDVVAHGQAETRPLACGLGGEERIEHLVLHVCRDAHAIVADANFHAVGKSSRRGLK